MVKYVLNSRFLITRNKNVLFIFGHSLAFIYHLHVYTLFRIEYVVYVAILLLPLTSVNPDSITNQTRAGMWIGFSAETWLFPTTYLSGVFLAHLQLHMSSSPSLHRFLQCYMYTSYSAVGTFEESLVQYLRDIKCKQYLESFAN